MSDYKSTEPYIYQPDGVDSPNYPSIYGLAGQGIPLEFIGMRYTKENAEKILEFIKAGSKPWSFEDAQKKAFSFQTPIHRSFQNTCEHVLELRAKLEKAEAVIDLVHGLHLGQRLDWKLWNALEEYRGETK